MINRYYICDTCNHTFMVSQPMHEKLRKKCPKCGKMSLYQDLTGQHVYVYGEPTTVGQQAEKNNRKFGNYGLEDKRLSTKRAYAKRKLDFMKKMGKVPIDTDTLPETHSPWYNPTGENLTKKVSKLDTPEKVHKYIKEGE